VIGKDGGKEPRFRLTFLLGYEEKKMSSKPKKIYLYFCANNTSRDLLVEKYNRIENDHVAAVSLPCTGKINLPYLLKAFETGADGVILVGCKKGECKNMIGNLHAEKRVGAVDSLLQEIGLPEGKIKIVNWDEAKPNETFSKISVFCRNILS